MKHRHLMDIQIKILVETERAIMVNNLKKENVWLPKSQIEIELGKAGDAIITMPEWLAIDKELV